MESAGPAQSQLAMEIARLEDAEYIFSERLRVLMDASRASSMRRILARDGNTSSSVLDDAATIDNSLRALKAVMENHVHEFINAYATGRVNLLEREELETIASALRNPELRTYLMITRRIERDFQMVLSEAMTKILDESRKEVGKCKGSA